MRARLPIYLIPLFTFCLVLLAGFAAPSLSCFVSPDETRQLSIGVAPGVNRTIDTSLWKGEGGQNSCTAHVQVELSAFPSSRLATRPSEIAAILRELTDEWGVDRCTVYVSYENDTQDELEEHELCLMGEFRFDKGDFWGVSSEGFCWEPSDLDVVFASSEEADFPG